MISFIEEHRADYGVEPICRVLPIAPSTFHHHMACRRDPSKLSARAQRDIALKPEIARVFDENFEVYGVRKVWTQMKREGFDIARCTVERLMRDMGLAGVIRGKKVRTTIPDKTASCPLDHVNRQFQAPAPNLLWVSDFTYVATWKGFVYVAFVIDVFAAISWDGGSVAQLIPILCWMLWNKRCTNESPFIKAGSFTTATGVANMFPSNIPNVWQRLALNHLLAVSVALMTTLWRKTDFTRLR